MIRRTYKTDPILHKGFAYQLLILRAAFHQRKIQLLIQNRLFNETRIIDGNLRTDGRGFLLEFLDQGGQKEIADGYAGANPERARLLPGRNFFFHFIEQGYDIKRIRCV